MAEPVSRFLGRSWLLARRVHPRFGTLAINSFRRSGMLSDPAGHSIAREIVVNFTNRPESTLRQLSPMSFSVHSAINWGRHP